METEVAVGSMVVIWKLIEGMVSLQNPKPALILNKVRFENLGPLKQLPAPVFALPQAFTCGCSMNLGASDSLLWSVESGI